MKTMLLTLNTFTIELLPPFLSTKDIKRIMILIYYFHLRNGRPKEECLKNRCICSNRKRLGLYVEIQIIFGTVWGTCSGEYVVAL